MCECVDGPAVVTDWARGDMVCRQCGVVLESCLMDESPEWHEWGVTEPKQTTASTASTAAATANTSKKRRRVAVAPEMSAREVWTAEGLRDVDRVVGCFGQSTTGSIAARARELFGDVAATRHCDRGALAAAAVYYAFKMEGVGRELQTVCDACGVQPAHMRAALDVYKECLADKPYYPLLFSRVTAGALLDVALDKLVAAGALTAGGRKDAWRAAMRLLDRLEDAMDSGRKPRTLCAGVVYLAACAHEVTKKQVAAACGVCSQTVDKIVAFIRSTQSAPPRLHGPLGDGGADAGGKRSDVHGPEHVHAAVEDAAVHGRDVVI